MKPPLFDGFFHKPVAAAVALISEDKTHVLMLESDGLWSTPGGKGEPGETHEQAARREFEEETGLTLGDIVEIHRFESVRFSIVRYVSTKATGTIRHSEEGKVSWRHVRFLGSKARFPKADSDLARLLADGGWTK